MITLETGTDFRRAARTEAAQAFGPFHKFFARHTAPTSIAHDAPGT